MLITILTLLIISSATTTKKEKSILYSRGIIQGLIFSSYIAYTNLYIVPLEKSVGLYGGFFYISVFSQSFNLFIFVIGAIIMILTSFYPRKITDLFSSIDPIMHKEKSLEGWDITRKFIINAKSNQFVIIEYSLIIVFILCGAALLINTADLISMFLSIELQSYGLYILSTLYKDSESATASGLTYFLLGGLSSCFILFGSALLYVNSGTTSFDNLYLVNNVSELGNDIVYWYNPYYIHFSLIVLAVGLLFKVSAAPFHFWSPDVYDGIPTIVTTFVATIAKISIFSLLLELVLYTDYKDVSIDLIYNLKLEGINWKNILLVSSLLSLIVGSILGLTQYRIKRLLAYSTISHVGFILLSLSICKIESIQAYIFYILQYSLSNVNMFFILIAIGFTLYLYNFNENLKKDSKSSISDGLIDIENSPIQLLDQIKGYFYINSYLSISLAITLFSFIGIPPLIGFFAKQMVLSAALDQGYVFMTLLGIITSVIGAVYYLNIVRLVFFEKSYYNLNETLYYNMIVYKLGYSLEMKSNTKLTNFVSINGVLSNSISILTMLILLFIYTPGEWFRIASLLSLTLFKT